jgi:hypothetical protein
MNGRFGQMYYNIGISLPLQERIKESEGYA